MEGARLSDLTMSGVASAAGGSYQSVDIQGVGKVQGDVECVDCHIEGVATILGSLRAERIRMNGKVTLEGDVLGETVNVEGQIKILGKCDAERFTGSGAFTIKGLLNAEDIKLQLYGPSQVGEMGAQKIRVETQRGHSLFGRFKTLSCDVIEGDDIYLENTKAKVVRGAHVVIGQACQIELVEYRETCEQHKSARIQSKIKL